MNEALNARIRENIASAIGHLVMEKIEAETTASALAGQVDALQKRVAEMTPKDEAPEE